MAETKTIVFGYKEIIQALVKQQGIHEGIWGLYVEFGLRAGNIKVGSSDEDVVPGLIVPLVKMGLQRFDKPTPFTVDAAQVNPLPKP